MVVELGGHPTIMHIVSPCTCSWRFPGLVVPEVLTDIHILEKSSGYNFHQLLKVTTLKKPLYALSRDLLELVCHRVFWFVSSFFLTAFMAC